MSHKIYFEQLLHCQLSQALTTTLTAEHLAQPWHAAEQTSQAGDLLVLLVSQYQQDCFDQWVQLARQRQLQLLPVRLSANGWQLGPLSDHSDGACLCCASSWEQKNHPHKQFWNELHTAANAASDWPAAPMTATLIASQLSMLLQAPALARNQVLSGSYQTLQSQWHRVLPNPHCVICATPHSDNAARAEIRLRPVYSAEPGQYRSLNSKLTEQNLRAHFVDPRYGLVKHLYKSANSQLVPMVCSEMPLLGELAQENSYGRTGTLSGCYRVSILEALERFAGHAPRNKKTVVRGNFAQLPNAVDPRQFVLHDNDDGLQDLRLVKPYDDELEHNWVWAWSFASSTSRLVPEQLAYYRLKNNQSQPVNRYVYECSNGCALGSSLEEAILYGLFEVIERDAYLTTWYGRITPTRLDVSDARDPQIRLLEAQAKALGYEPYIFDITMESGITAIWAMLVNPAEDAPVKSYCAAGAHLDPEKAVMGALVEVMTSMKVYEESLPAYREKAQTMLADVTQVKDMADHVLLYSQADTLQWLSFLCPDQPAVPMQRRYHDFYQQTPQQNLTLILQQVIDRCVAAYGDVLVVDQTFDALAPLDLFAVKVLVPNTHTITFGHQYQRVSLQRVNQARANRQLPIYPQRALLNVHVPHNFP